MKKQHENLGFHSAKLLCLFFSLFFSFAAYSQTLTSVDSHFNDWTQSSVIRAGGQDRDHLDNVHSHSLALTADPSINSVFIGSFLAGACSFSAQRFFPVKRYLLTKSGNSPPFV